MKKIVLWVMIAVFIMGSAESVFAVYDPLSPKAKAFNKKIENLLREIKTFADNIAAFNKSAFEAQLTRKEREYYDFGDEPDFDPPKISPVMWDRVYVKDKTLVLASAKQDKKFTATAFATTDPAFVFMKNIRVGASVKVLENYFNDTIKNIGHSKGKRIIVVGPLVVAKESLFPVVSIVCENGLITQIKADFPHVDEDALIMSKKAEKFADGKMKQIGFKGFSDLRIDLGDYRID